MENNNLPFPESKQGWGIAIVATLLLFLFFYGFLFQWIKGMYQGQVIQIKPMELSDDFSDMTLDVQIPRYVSSYIDRDLYIWLENRKSEQVDIQIKLLAKVNRADVSNEDTAFPMSVLIASQFEQNFIQNGSDIIEIGLVPSRSRVYKAVRFRLPESTDLEEVHYTILIYQKQSQNQQASRPEHQINLDAYSIANNSSSIIAELMKSVMLPPLSNGLIPLIALVSAFSFDKALEPEDNNKKKRLYVRLAVVLRAGLILFSVCFVLQVYLWLISLTSNSFLLLLFSLLCIILTHCSAWILVRFTAYLSEQDNIKSWWEMLMNPNKIGGSKTTIVMESSESVGDKGSQEIGTEQAENRDN